MTPFIANTDKAGFEFLANRSVDGVVDEVNFWSPKSLRPMKQMDPGEPVFFRLKRPDYAIAGYGFFATFSVLDLDDAWTFFGWKNGDPDKSRFLERIGWYRGIDLFDPGSERAPLGCTILRSARLWPPSRWIPWKDEMGWAPNIVQGKGETDEQRAELLVREVLADRQDPPEEFAESFSPVDADERLIVSAESLQREGQGAFRARLLDAYERRCAITGEHTQPVLDAAHIQPYLGPRSNHIQNGLVLTKECHALFDRGLVTVTPDYIVRVSTKIRAEWKNGHRYYPFDDRPLEHLPALPGVQPSQEALEWHGRRIFRD